MANSLTWTPTKHSTIISVFAIIILSVLGLLFKNNHPELVGGDDDPEDGPAVAATVFIAVMVYAVRYSTDLPFTSGPGLRPVSTDKPGPDSDPLRLPFLNYMFWLLPLPSPGSPLTNCALLYRNRDSSSSVACKASYICARTGGERLHCDGDAAGLRWWSG